MPQNNLVAPSEGLRAIFASQSLDRQLLAIYFMLNTEEVLDQCRSTWSWSRLQSLALALQFLEDDWEKHKRLEALLCRTGVLVRNMPKRCLCFEMVGRHMPVHSFNVRIVTVPLLLCVKHGIWG